MTLLQSVRDVVSCDGQSTCGIGDTRLRTGVAMATDAAHVTTVGRG